MKLRDGNNGEGRDDHNEGKKRTNLGKWKLLWDLITVSDVDKEEL